MAKLVLLLVLVCFQFSLQEELGKLQFELIKDEIPLNVELLDGEDKNQWNYQKDDDDVKPLEGMEENEWKFEAEDDLDDDFEWTESDEEWLEQLGSFSDEDYDYNSEEFDKLMDEIDKYFDEKYPDDDEWLDEVDDYDWEEFLSKFPQSGKQGKEGKNGKNNLNIYYSWLLRLNERKNNRKQISKRFSSV